MCLLLFSFKFVAFDVSSYGSSGGGGGDDGNHNDAKMWVTLVRNVTSVAAAAAAV